MWFGHTAIADKFLDAGWPLLERYRPSSAADYLALEGLDVLYPTIRLPQGADLIKNNTEGVNIGTEPVRRGQGYLWSHLFIRR